MYENNLNLVSASTAISKLNKIKKGLLTEKNNLVVLLDDKNNLSSLSINARKEEINEFISKIDPVCAKIDSVVSSINNSVVKVNKEIELNNIKSKTTTKREGTEYGGRENSLDDTRESNDTKVEIKNYSGYGKLQQEKY